jgi:hypothetical protein
VARHRPPAQLLDVGVVQVRDGAPAADDHRRWCWCGCGCAAARGGCCDGDGQGRREQG